jgi:hypothetical protein
MLVFIFLLVTIGAVFCYTLRMMKAVCTGLAFVVLISCNARVQGRLEADSSGEFAVSAVLEPRVSSLIRSLRDFAGDAPNENIVDGGAISRSMAASPGVASASFRNTGPAALEGPVKISRIADFLAPAGGRGGLMSLEPVPGGLSRLTISLNRESGSEMLSLLSADIGEYLSALMAPLATGENLAKAEYLELVGAIYGRAVVDEISRGAIRAFIDFPGGVFSVKGGVFSGNRAEFVIPLVDLLVLETPLVYEVVWKQ